MSIWQNPQHIATEAQEKIFFRLSFYHCTMSAPQYCLVLQNLINKKRIYSGVTISMVKDNSLWNLQQELKGKYRANKTEA